MEKLNHQMKGLEKPVKKFFEDFKKFIAQGNVINLAVGVMIGGAFGKIVTSLVGDMFMPLIGLITGKVDLSGLFIALDGGSYPSAAAAAAAGVGTLNYGTFLTNVIDFLLLALCVFLFVQGITKLMPKKPEEAPVPTRECPFCKSTINAAATRCPNCTSTLANE